MGHFGKIGFWDNGQKWPKCRFLWDKMAILSPIGLKVGLPITLHVNDGQNKLEVCISKNMAKIGSKMASRPTLANVGMAITWSPYIRFRRLTPLKWSAHRDESIGVKTHELYLVPFEFLFFFGHFMPLVATWTMMGAWTPNHLQNVGTCPTHPPQLVTQNWVF